MVIFGLKNHAPDDYRDKSELEHRGKLEVTKMTAEERAELDRQAEQHIIDTFGPLIEHQRPQEEPGE